jgi:hypothetical protein
VSPTPAKPCGPKASRSETVRSNGPADYVVPVPGSYRTDREPDRHRLRFPGDSGYSTFSFNVNTFSDAYLWDGEPAYQTGWGFGH